MPAFCPSRLERHNFTFTAHQSSNSLCLETLFPATFFILVFGSLAMVAVQGSSALADLPTPVTEKKSFRSLGLSLTIVVHSISLSGDKLFPLLELLRASFFNFGLFLQVCPFFSPLTWRLAWFSWWPPLNQPENDALASPAFHLSLLCWLLCLKPLSRQGVKQHPRGSSSYPIRTV